MLIGLSERADMVVIQMRNGDDSEYLSPAVAEAFAEQIQLVARQAARNNLEQATAYGL